MTVEPKYEGVGAIPKQCQPPRVHDDGVENIAMQHKEAPAVCGDVDRFLGDFHATELQANVPAQPLVVIARDVNDPGALADLAQDFLNDIIVRLRPIPRFLQPPAVDDVANQVDRLGFGFAEKIEEEFGLATARAEMHVRNPDRAVLMQSPAAGHRASPGPTDSERSE